MRWKGELCPERGVHGYRHRVGRGLGLVGALESDLTARMCRLEDSAAELDVRREEFRGATLKGAALHGRVREGKVQAGRSAGLVREVLPAAEVVERIITEYRTAPARLSRLLGAAGERAGA